MRIAILILNRNLPSATNKLVEHLKIYDQQKNIFVIEAGSDENKLSKYCTWNVQNKEVKLKGLRYSRGMNYGLLKLWKSKKWKEYDAFFLLTNDTEFEKKDSISKLKNYLLKYPKIGILSPSSSSWGENRLINDYNIKFFWHIHNTAYLLRRQFIEQIINTDSPNYYNFLFDGSNFRGCFSESELIAKAYANNWGAAITNKVFVNENENYLLKNAKIIKTDIYNKNQKLYFEEGRKWLKNKYGFNNKWQMNEYVKFHYDNFFILNPNYLKYKI